MNLKQEIQKILEDHFKILDINSIEVIQMIACLDNFQIEIFYDSEDSKKSLTDIMEQLSKIEYKNSDESFIYISLNTVIEHKNYAKIGKNTSKIHKDLIESVSNINKNTNKNYIDKNLSIHGFELNIEGAVKFNKDLKILEIEDLIIKSFDGTEEISNIINNKNYTNNVDFLSFILLHILCLNLKYLKLNKPEEEIPHFKKYIKHIENYVFNDNKKFNL